MKEEFLDYVEDVVETMGDALRFVDGLEYDDFVRDKKTVYAVTRAVEIIGDAVKNIPSKVKKRYPKIPWRKMAGMRDKLIHEYFGVDLRRVWNVVERDIPTLKPLFERILKDFEK